MANNVIPFRSHASRENLEKAERERKVVSDRIRANKMRQRLEEKPIIHSESDRFHVAKNLGRILENMKSKDYRPAMLLRQLGMGQAEESTKRLYNYTLRADATLEKARDRVSRLTKKAAKYLRIAEAAAKVMNDDQELIVLRLFENTKYQVTEDISDEQVAYLEQMRDLLVTMANAAIRRNDLKSYLEILESKEIGWDIDGSFGNFRSVPPTVFLDDRLARHVSYLGYVPSVLLYRRFAELKSPIEGEAFQIDFDKNANTLKDFWHGEGDLPRKNQSHVRVEVASEVWFGIAPMESSWKVEPIFEKRYAFRIEGCGNEKSIRVTTYDPNIVRQLILRPIGPAITANDLVLRRNWLELFAFFPNEDDRGEIVVGPLSKRFDDSVDGNSFRREHLEGRWLIALKHFDEENLDIDEDIEVGEGQFYYERVDLASCKKYLDQFCDPSKYHFYDICASVGLNDHLWPSDCVNDPREAWYLRDSSWGWPIMHTAAPEGSIARAIEQNLLEADTDQRLDTVLFRTVAERVQNARNYYESVLEQRNQQIANLLKSWESS